jgi:molybdopterin/thiamine biosynthesis adenylyltransferase
VKVILGIGDPLVGRLLHYDALPARISELTLDADPECRYCREGAVFPGYVDYDVFCSSAGQGT